MKENGAKQAAGTKHIVVNTINTDISNPKLTSMRWNRPMKNEDPQ
jgi:hypothetical protein